MKIGIVGHYAKNQNITDGQTIKIRNLYYELKKKYSDIKLVDTFNWKKHPFKLFINCFKCIVECENILILPARNGIKVFFPLFTYLNKIFNKKLYYVVVGGWLPDVVIKNKKYLKYLKKMDMIFVETIGMKEQLKIFNLFNVEVLYNFKNIKTITLNQIKKFDHNHISACTFSRVIKEKGIENAINAITSLNNKLNKKIFSLDIYGPIGENYKEEFEKILKDAPNFISYKGVIDSNKSTDILKKYDLLLFPTYYDGEGFAGTIIDAFSSGVVVIASDWKYNKDIIVREQNGFLFKVKSDNEMIRILEKIYNNEYNILTLKKNCLNDAKKYVPKEAIKVLLKYIDGDV